MPSWQGRQARLPFDARLAPDSRRELFDQLVRLLPSVLRPRGFPVAGIRGTMPSSAAAHGLRTGVGLLAPARLLRKLWRCFH
jgi:hypothetical protein